MSQEKNQKELTTICVRQSNGLPALADVRCNGKLIGRTDGKSGILQFHWTSNETIKILATFHNHMAFGQVKSGSSLDLILTTD